MSYNLNQKSSTGLVLKAGDNILAWKSIRQALTAYSATESELEGMTTGVEQGLKLRETMQEVQAQKVACNPYGDNVGATLLANPKP